MPVRIIILDSLELFACLAGFFCYKKLKGTYWQYFPFYLFGICLTEIVAGYFLFVKADLVTNIAIYKYWGIPYQFLFFYWLFSRYLNNSLFNKIPYYCMALYILAWFFDQVWLSKLKLLFDSPSYSIGCILLLILLLLTTSVFVKSDEIIRLKTSMIFWVMTGLFTFYIGSIAFWGLRTTLYYNYRSIFDVYNNIQFVLNCLMYLNFTFSFVWGKPK